MFENLEQKFIRETEWDLNECWNMISFHVMIPPDKSDIFCIAESKGYDVWMSEQGAEYMRVLVTKAAEDAKEELIENWHRVND